jgi:hypothetical protein
MGTVYRQKGRTIWMLKYYREGRPIVESSGTDDKTKAKKLVRAHRDGRRSRLADVLRGREDPV